MYLFLDYQDALRFGGLLGQDHNFFKRKMRLQVQKKIFLPPSPDAAVLHNRFIVFITVVCAWIDFSYKDKEDDNVAKGDIDLSNTTVEIHTVIFIYLCDKITHLCILYYKFTDFMFHLKLYFNLNVNVCSYFLLLKLFMTNVLRIFN